MGAEVFNVGDAMAFNAEVADAEGGHITTGGNHVGRIDHQFFADDATYNSGEANER